MKSGLCDEDSVRFESAEAELKIAVPSFVQFDKVCRHGAVRAMDSATATRAPGRATLTSSARARCWLPAIAIISTELMQTGRWIWGCNPN